MRLSESFVRAGITNQIRYLIQGTDNDDLPLSPETEEILNNLLEELGDLIDNELDEIRARLLHLESL